MRKEKKMSMSVWTLYDLVIEDNLVVGKTEVNEWWGTEPPESEIRKYITDSNRTYILDRSTVMG